ncbi:hypothetical protein HN51_000383, partial [Arachis hypogaea]
MNSELLMVRSYPLEVTMLEQHQKKNFRCCIFRGSMAKLDALSGAIIWQTYMLPDNNGTVG